MTSNWVSHFWYDDEGDTCVITVEVLELAYMLLGHNKLKVAHTVAKKKTFFFFTFLSIAWSGKISTASFFSYC